MKTYEWKNQAGPRSRRAWLLLVKGDVVYEFKGDAINGVVVIIGQDYTSQGRWSYTTYRLYLAPGVRPIAGHNGFETGTFNEGLREATSFRGPVDRWIDIANALGVSLSSAEAFVRATRPKHAQRFDEVEAAIKAIDEVATDGSETLTFTFGSPSRRLREAGFWSWPVVIYSDNGQEVGRVTQGNGSWSTPAATGNVHVLSAESASGHRGGNITLTLAVPAGCRAEHEPPYTV